MPDTSDPRLLINVVTLAHMLNVHRRTIDRHVLNDPDFPKPLKLANRSMFVLDEVNEWIRRGIKMRDAKTASASGVAAE